MDPRIISLILIASIVIAVTAYDFVNKTKEERINTLINWAKAAVWDAEEYFGSGTGKIKLAQVYKEAIELFPWLGKMFTYDEFDAKIIKPALEWLDEVLKNPNAQGIINK